MLAIPLTRAARQRARVQLAGQAVRLTVWWSLLAARWYLSIAWADDRPIALGMQIALYSRLLRARATLAGLRGDLMVVPPYRGAPEPGREAWSEGYRLLYLTAGEVGGLDVWR